MSTYTYQLALNIKDSHDVWVPICLAEISNNIITRATKFTSYPTSFSFNFTTALNTSDKTLLDTIVAKYNKSQEIIDYDVTIYDIKTIGTNGGATTAAVWMTRDLNTLDSSYVSSWLTLSSNTIKLVAGKYLFEGVCPLNINYISSTRQNGVGNNLLRILNVTDNITEYQGMNLSQSIYCTITATKTTSYVLQQKCQYAISSNGLGSSTGYGNYETYSTVKITKL